jgi:hypothetical protein
MIFKTVEIIKTEENNHYLEWEMSPEFTGDIVDNYNFKISWSNSPSAGFVFVEDENGVSIVIDGALGPLSYTHPRKQYDFTIGYYYRIHCIAKDPPNNEKISNIQYIGMALEGYHEVMKRNEYLLYSQYAGNPSTVIKRKTWGTHCPLCWDNLRRQTTKSKCPTCNGTGLVVGYYQPIEVQISYETSPKDATHTQTGMDVFSTIGARMSNYPIVRPGDIVINNDTNRRYKINSPVHTTELPLRATYNNGAPVLSKQNYVISQLLVLKEIVSSDPEYDLRPGNITDVPQIEEPGSGAFINFHKPVTVTDPLNITIDQYLTLKYNVDDFYIENRQLRSVSGNSETMIKISGEDINFLNRVIYSKNDGTIGVANKDVSISYNKVIGINVSLAMTGQNIIIKRNGIITDDDWNWIMGKHVFFDNSGVLTQVYSKVGFYMPIAIPVTPTSILILLSRPILFK